MDAVRLLDRPSGRPPRRGPGVGGAVIAVAVVVLLMGVTIVAAPTVQIAPSVPQDPLTADYPAAAEVARSFVVALDRKDAEAARSLLDPATARLVLPAMPFRFVAMPAAEAEVRRALEFYVEVVDVDAGDCAIDSQDLGGSAQVTCGIRVDGDFATVGRVGGRTVPVVFGIREGRITDVLGGYAGAPLLSSYCWWVERTVGVEPVPLFDTECRPIASAEAAARHRDLAADYLAAAAATRTGRRYRITRSWVRSAELLVDVLNSGMDGGPLIESGTLVRRAPGLLGAPGAAPTLAEFLAWSATVYEIDRGTCSVDGTAATTTFRLVCPHASWHGPLVRGLGFERIAQPATFVVGGATVLGIEGETAPALQASFADFCAWVRDARPRAAPSALAVDTCTPLYSADAGRRLLQLLGAYPGLR